MNPVDLVRSRASRPRNEDLCLEDLLLPLKVIDDINVVDLCLLIYGPRS